MLCVQFPQGRKFTTQIQQSPKKWYWLEGCSHPFFMRWDGSVLIHWLWQQLWGRNNQSKSAFGGRNRGNWPQVDTVALYTGLKSIHWQRRNILTTLGCKGLSQQCWWYVHFGVYPGTVTVQADFKKLLLSHCFVQLLLHIHLRSSYYKVQC